MQLLWETNQGQKIILEIGEILPIVVVFFLQFCLFRKVISNVLVNNSYIS